MATLRVETYKDGKLVATRDEPVPPEVVNEGVLRDKAAAALEANAAFLALPSPTQAQSLAQIERLTRQCSALSRLLLRRHDGVEGT